MYTQQRPAQWKGTAWETRAAPATPTSYLHDPRPQYQRQPSLKLLNTLPAIPLHPTRAKILEFRDTGITVVDIWGVDDLERYWAGIDASGFDSDNERIRRQDSLREDEREHTTGRTTYRSHREEADISSASSSRYEADNSDRIGRENPQNGKDRDPCRGRLYLLEDITLPYISALGHHFTIDPRFFAEYLKFDPDRTYQFMSGHYTMRNLASLRYMYSHATFVYHEVRTFIGVAPRREEYEILTHDNVSRLVTTVDHRRGRFTGLVRRNMGIWWRDTSSKKGSDGRNEGEGAEGSGPWDAIILVDPPMTSELKIRPWKKNQDFTPISCPNTGYLDGYLDFSTWPPPEEPPPPSFPDPRHSTSSTYSPLPEPQSMLSDIIHHWHHAPTPDFLSALSHPKRATSIPQRIMSSYWNLQLDYLVAVVSELEKGLLNFEQMDAHPSCETINEEVTALRSLLSDLNSWRRRLFFYLEQMMWNIEAVSLSTSSPSLSFPSTYLQTTGAEREDTAGAEEEEEEQHAQSRLHIPTMENLSSRQTPIPSHPKTYLTPPNNPWQPHKNDLTTIHTHLHLILKRVQSIIPVVMGAFSLLEARQSVSKADLTLRLSGVALVFVPLSFTAEFLSMTDPFQPGRRHFWVFFVISGPLIFALFWWAFWGQVVGIGRWVVGRLRAGQLQDGGANVDGDGTGMGIGAWKAE